MKRFYFRFGIDTLSAQALKTKDADSLTVKIINFLFSAGVYTVDETVISWYAERELNKTTGE